MSGNVLVVYGSKCGSTGEVAAAIGETLREAGVPVDVRPVKDVDDLSPYSAVVIGSAARMGRLLPEVVKFAERHRDTLKAKPTACFTVCLTLKDDTPENREKVSAYLDPLRAIAEPVSVGLFAGKLDYARLGFLLRFFMSRDRSGGLAEGDYRDWEAIRTWARELAPALVG